MAKERARSGSIEHRCHASPFSNSGHKNSSPSSSRDTPCEPTTFISPQAKEIKEWEDICCPVCLEHPHNAVLLMCTSQGKGCRPFICDTSYRHSNCFDQFRKAFSGSNTPLSEALEKAKLPCPLCRGLVTGWEVVEPARLYMNSKSRSCSLENCEFNGAYGQLRRHARTEHPSVCPTDADPERVRDWRSMEQERDIGDLISSLHSTIRGGRRRADIDELIREDVDELEGTRHPLYRVAFYLVVRVHHPELLSIGQSSHPSVIIHSRRTSRRRRRGANLWGEAFNEQEPVSRHHEADDNDNDGLSRSESDSDGIARGRPRRRLRMSDNEEE